MKTKMRKNWWLGFLGFLGFFGFQEGLMKHDFFGALWLIWFIWFAYFIPEKKK